MISRENLEDLYPLAPMQEGMLFHWLLAPGSDAYREQVAWRVRGSFDVTRFEACWDELVRRHAVLRTVFVHEKAARPLQMVLKTVTTAFRAEDLRALAPDARDARAARLRHAARGRGFDLAAEPPSRVAVLCLADDRFEIVWTFHHIILDGWSVGLLMADLLRLYAAGGSGGAPGAAAPVPYSRYIQWLEARDREPGRRFWREHLEGYAGPASIPSSRPGWLPDAYAAAQTAFTFEPAQTTALERLARETEVTPGTLVEALWAILLARHQPPRPAGNARHDLAFGVVVSGRPPSLSGADAMVGLFTNTIPLRVRFDEAEPFSEFLARLQAEVVAAQEHAYLPLAEVQAAPGMIDHLIAYENYPRDARIAASVSAGEFGFTIEAVDALEQAPYDLNVVFAPGERIAVTFHFNTSRYAPEQIARLFGQLRALATAAVASPHASIGDLDVVPDEERDLLRRFTSTRVERAGAQTIQGAIGRWIRDAPDAAAIVDGQRVLTYAGLDARARRLSTALGARCALKPGTRVAVVLERSADLPVAWLAILRAGCVYVPIDPIFPDDRIGFMVADSACPVVLTNAPRREALQGLLGAAAVHDVEALAAPGGEPPMLDDAPAQACAYVIYTSGSTGTPKGVAVGHAGVLNVAAHLGELHPIGTGDRVVLFASPSFDASIWEMCVALCHGAALVVADRETVADPARFGAFLRHHACTITVLPPAYIRLLDAGDLAGLELLASAGEAASADTARQLGDRVRFVNLYGPTEASIMVTSYVVAPHARFSRSVPIGAPIPNVEALVLDPRGRLAPVGAPGELCVAGVCVALGYLNRPQLTAERFPAHPLDPDRRMYRTGDVVRWLDDGTLEFVGRTDDQVKVRGHRVELGEVQACLQSSPGVRQAAVIVVPGEDGATELVAYLVPGADVSLSGIRDHLRRALPEFMMPSRLVTLERLPLTPQGKLDRGALPKHAAESEQPIAAPRDPLEADLVAAWQSALGVTRVGIHDSFFDLGGHSLTAVRLAARVSKGLGHRLEVRDLFEHPTVAGLAAVLRGREVPDATPIARVPDAADYEVSHAQRRLWLLHHLSDAVAAYNIAGAFALEGAIDPGALDRACAALVERHEALRTTFLQVDGRVRQRVQPVPGGPIVECVDVSAAADPEAAAMALLRAAQARRFDLEHGPLVRFVLVAQAPSRHLFAVVLHHIAADGWSVGVLIRELSRLYESIASGRDAGLAPLAVRHRDVTAWLNARPTPGDLAYWRRQLGGTLPALNLPTDRPRPAQRSFRGATRSRTVPAEARSAVSAVARAANATVFMVLVAAVKALLARYSGERDIIVGYPAAGRDHPDLDGQVGFFVHTVALRDEVRPEATFSGLLAAVRRTLLDGLEHQACPFDRIVEELGAARDPSRHPVFDVMVAYERLGRDGLRLPGVSVLPVSAESGTSKFDLLFAFNESETSLEVAVEYSTDLFEPATIDRMLDHLLTLLGAAMDTPGAAIGSLPLLTVDERRALRDGPVARVDHDPAESVVSRIERAVRTCPDSLAVVSGTGRLTYRELDARSSALASALVRDGAARRDVPIGVLIDRSVDMVVGIVGILKAGGAYLPLDPALPAPRLAAMIADADAPTVVSHGRLAALAAGFGVPVVYLDRVPENRLESPPPAVHGCDVAYLMYTSGSTGRPNGVLVEHRNVLALLDAYEHVAPRRAALAGIALCPFGFDVSVWEMFSCLCAGGTLHVLASEIASDPGSLVRYVHEHGITSAYLPPALVDAVGDALAGVGGAALDRLLVGVEPIRNRSLDRLRRAVPGLRIVNGYGPTEATVCATFMLFEDGADPDDRVPIGRAARGYEVHLLDAAMQQVPIGVPGEIYVGGAGLARGYAGRAALTARRFVPNPFAPGRGSRLYRTGDLARRLPDGAIRFLGRVDHQVKVRGFRVEPGEIESTLRAHPAVREAVVIARDAAAGGSQLVAYVAGQGFDPVSGAEPAGLRAFVKARLPEYMVPAALVALAELPRTANGKVDRDALPPPPERRAPAEGASPLTATESLLQRLWSEVLRVEGVGCEDDFFDLGGHSLLAMRLLGRIREACGVELALRVLFAAPTVRAAAAHIDAERPAAACAWSLAPIGPVARDRAPPLSFAQQRLWFIEQLEPGSAYNVPVALALEGVLDGARLGQALNAVIARHESLRTRFVAVDGMPAQEILAARPIPCPSFDLSALDASAAEAETEAEVGRRAAELVSRPFDLATEPLVRAALLKLAPERHVLLLSIHHIVVDGWSMGVLMRELGASYTGESLPELALQYADYAAWQRDARNERALSTQLDYWRARLAGLAPLLALPTDRPRARGRAKRAGLERFVLPPVVAARLRQRALELNATLFMTVLAALDALLARISGQSDIAIGTPVANRTRPEIEPLIGFFANTVVVRADLDDDPSFATLVGRVRDSVLGAYAHQDVPFEQVVDALQPERSLAHTPLFQVLFILHNAPLEPVTVPDLRVRALDQPATTAKFDLTVAIEERDDGLAGAVEYDTDLFDAGTVRTLVSALGTLIADAVERPELAVSRLALLTPAQRGELIERQSRASPAARGDAVVTALVAAQIGRSPRAVAIEDGPLSLTYAELDARANQLAHHLRALGAGPNVPVGLCVARSAELLVALLGILRSGAGVVPLDPTYPPERLSVMLREAAVTLLVGGEIDPGVRAVDLARDRHAIEAGPVSPVPVTNAPDDLLYLLFTSGSTGVPKGVEVPHRVIANLVAWGRAGQGFESPARTLQFTPLSFDVSFQEIFTCWASGGTLVVIDDERRRDSSALLAFLRETRIERLFAPFVALQGLAEAAANEADDRLPSSLRQVITAGEQLRTTNALAALFSRLGECELHNHYGPTETHVLTAHRLRGAPSTWPTLPPIGRAIAGARLYVLDAHAEPVPEGMPGELFAGGVTLARGYVNRPELTAERFVPDPLVGDGLAYRTGDRVRLRADGAYEFLGRNDEQVKIRGFRVEPGEIEAVLTRLAGVAQAAVALDERVDPARLVACVVAAPGADLDADALRGAVLEVLPEYMVPASFAVLPSLPLTPSGKVNRRALAGLVAIDAGRERPRAAPRTDSERALAGIFAQVLELPAVGVDESFFDLGGHSLLATRLASRVRKVFGVQLALRRIFEAPSVERLARVIDEAPRTAPEAAPLVPVDRSGALPLAFAQERLWFLDRLAVGATYNMPAALRLVGPLDVGALQGAIDALIERHEILRTRFVERGGGPAQLVSPAAPVGIRRVDLSGLAGAARDAEVRRLAAEEAHAPFVLAEGPLLRVTLLDLGPRERVLVVVLHHILADGWSIAILVRELVSLYAAFADGRPSPLPPLPLQYGDFACWQRSVSAERALAPHREYWARQLAGAAPVIRLPLDRQRTGAPDLKGGAIPFVLDRPLCAALGALARRTQATLHATLLAAFAALLFRVSGQEDLTIGTPVGHRPRPDLEPLIGLFLNVLPIRVRCGGFSTAGALCRSTQAITLDAFAHGDLPFEQIVAAAGSRRQASHAPLFQVLFVLQNAPRASLALPGVDIEPVAFESTAVKYDLTLALEESDGGLAGALEYAADVFDTDTAVELVEAYQAVVRAMADDPGARIIDLPLGPAPPGMDADAGEDDFAFGRS